MRDREAEELVNTVSDRLAERDAETLSETLETLSNSRRRPGGRPPSAPQPGSGSRSTSFGGKNKTKQTCRRRVDEAIFLLSLPLSPVRMASLRNTREALLLGYSEGWLDEMEFLALYDLNTSENLEFPYDSYDQFNLDDIDEAECIAEFRFEKRHILQLEEVLQIPALLKCDQRSVFTGTEGLCLLLKRLAYPCRYSDLIYRFGRPVPVLCMITNKVIDYIYDTHHRQIILASPTYSPLSASSSPFWFAFNGNFNFQLETSE